MGKYAVSMYYIPESCFFDSYSYKQNSPIFWHHFYEKLHTLKHIVPPVHRHTTKIRIIHLVVHINQPSNAIDRCIPFVVTPATTPYTTQFYSLLHLNPTHSAALLHKSWNNRRRWGIACCLYFLLPPLAVWATWRGRGNPYAVRAYFRTTYSECRVRFLCINPPPAGGPQRQRRLHGVWGWGA